ncbi:MAG: hypothetical protein GTO03_04300, partial [Planctomycetales bacterium]|nr:hypothetical protein [Planctomycetales bacterium]
MDQIAAFKQAFPEGRIYNACAFGGAVIFHGHPGWKVAIDGRLYLYSKREWDLYHSAARGERS